MIAKHKEIEANAGNSRSSLTAAKFKLSGVKRILYAGVLPQSQENRHNVKILLQSLKLFHLPPPTLSSPAAQRPYKQSFLEPVRKQ